MQMNEALLLYQQLLQANQDAFELGLFRVAFHALSGALQCIPFLPHQDKSEKIARLTEVEKRVSEQMEALNQRTPPQELELNLYVGLAQSVRTQSVLLRIGTNY